MSAVVRSPDSIMPSLYQSSSLAQVRNVIPLLPFSLTSEVSSLFFIASMGHFWEKDAPTCRCSGSELGSPYREHCMLVSISRMRYLTTEVAISYSMVLLCQEKNSCIHSSDVSSFRQRSHHLRESPRVVQFPGKADIGTFVTALGVSQAVGVISIVRPAEIHTVPIASRCAAILTDILVICITWQNTSSLRITAQKAATKITLTTLLIRDGTLSCTILTSVDLI